MYNRRHILNFRDYSFTTEVWEGFVQTLMFLSQTKVLSLAVHGQTCCRLVLNQAEDFCAFPIILDFICKAPFMHQKLLNINRE